MGKAAGAGSPAGLLRRRACWRGVVVGLGGQVGRSARAAGPGPGWSL